MRKMNKLIRVTALLSAILLLVSGQAATVAKADDVPYDTYNYDYREYIHFTPPAYIPDGIRYGREFEYNGESIGNFKTPQDMCKSPTGEVLVADTGNNRVVILDSKLKNVVKIITTFDNNGKEDKLNQPYGVCVSEKGNIYIADSKNKRVVVLDPEYNLIQIVSDPKSRSLDAGFVFTPYKVAVDYADRVYVIAQNMFEGIMVFETDGQFTGFFGTISVDISLWEKFWRRIATKEERANQKLFIPTEFTGIDVDPEGFIYATNITSDGIQGVRRLNPSGQDVIKKGQNKNLGGDLQISGLGAYYGPSQFTDVVYRSNGIYSCLDRKRGRIFTYDHEGNLLYIFGGLGTQVGTFQMPVAIEELGDRICVLDATAGTIISFKMTEYGDCINRAVALRFDGDETEAFAIWQIVLELDENNELANTGIGKAYLSGNDYKNAMKYLKLGMNREYYSIAFKRYRNEILKNNASWFLSGVAVLIIAAVVFSKVRKKRKEALGND
ncbi:MAG: NHL repeat-containing protein [Lachnospiraceae bacterium]|nr:NHL repeat-containing protein [Lachnospiraceae bacterium]